MMMIAPHTMVITKLIIQVKYSLCWTLKNNNLKVENLMTATSNGFVKLGDTYLKSVQYFLKIAYYYLTSVFS